MFSLCRKHKKKKMNLFCMQDDCDHKTRFGCVDCFGSYDAPHHSHFSQSTTAIEDKIKNILDESKVSIMSYVDNEHQEYSRLLDKVDKHNSIFRFYIKDIREKFNKTLQEIEAFMDQQSQLLSDNLFKQIQNLDWMIVNFGKKVSRPENIDYLKDPTQHLSSVILKEQQDLIVKFLDKQTLLSRTVKKISVRNSIIDQIQKMEVKQTEFQAVLEEEIKRMRVIQSHLKEYTQENFQPFYSKSIVHKIWKKTDLVTPAKNVIISLGKDNRLRRWLIEKNELENFEDLQGEASCSPWLYENTLYVGNKDFTLKLYDLETCKLKKTLPGHLGALTNILRIQKTIVTSDDQGMIIIWDKNGTQISQILAHTKKIKEGCLLHFQTETVLTFGEDMFLRLWNINNQNMVKESKLEYDLNCIGIIKGQTSSVGQKVAQLILAPTKGGLVVWNMNKLAQIGECESKEIFIDVQQIAQNVMACYSKQQQVHIFQIYENNLSENQLVDLKNTIYSIYSFTGNDIPTYDESLYRPVILWR